MKVNKDNELVMEIAIGKNKKKKNLSLQLFQKELREKISQADKLLEVRTEVVSLKAEVRYLK